MTSTTVTPATSIAPGDRIRYGDDVLEVLEIAISVDRRYVHLGIVDVDGLPSGITLDARLDVRIVSDPATRAIEILATQAASHLEWMLGEMIRIRRDDAAERGVTVTDEEIAADVRASISRMIEEAGR